MKKSALPLIILFAILVSGCAASEKPIGGDKDSHGCLIPAGYSWCESKQKCLRTWEEPCTGMVRSFKECEALGYSVMESYPRQCRTPEGETFTEDIEAQIPEQYCTKAETGENMSLSEAKNIAINSECAQEGTLKDTNLCNENSGTWWIDLNIEKQGCNPACVVDIATKNAEINWRCTGLIPPPAGSAPIIACPPQKNSSGNIMCTMEYAPVCGNDGKTYSNGCVACASGTGSYQQGECSQAISTCATDSDCQTPASYLIRSVCPYSSKCIDNNCEVVCAMYTHAAAPNISESYPVKCEKDTDCDCKSYLPENMDYCACLDNGCFAVIKE